MRSWITALSVTFTWTMSGTAFAEDMLMKDLPESVRKTVEKEAKGARIEDLEREKRPDGTVYYEVELERDDQEWELTIDAAGKVVERKRET